MMAATHRLGGTVVGTLLAHTVKADMYTSGILIAGAVLGSILPDIDNRNSSISRKWSVICFLVTIGQSIIRLFSGLLPERQRKFVKSLIGHRGITHSYLAVCLLPAFTVLIGKAAGYEKIGVYAAVGIAGGMESHLLFDLFSGGVPLLMPFTTKRICLARMKTGGLSEWIFRIILTVILGLEVFVSWQRLLQ